MRGIMEHPPGWRSWPREHRIDYLQGMYHRESIVEGLRELLQMEEHTPQSGVPDRLTTEELAVLFEAAYQSTEGKR
jgi:hypothetical protein